MHERRLRTPSPALVVSLVALFVALGGTTYAAVNLPKNSVGTRQLRRNAVTSAKIENGAVIGSKIRNGAVTARKIDAAGLTVPDATHATAADSATNATHAATADSATSAATATNAGELGGQAPSAYAPASLFGSPPAESNSTVSDPNCFVSEIKLLAGKQAPAAWHLADGSLLPISSYAALFSLLGTTYGGNGTTNFALPDLRAADPKGGGPAGVNYYICTGGIFP